MFAAPSADFTQGRICAVTAGAGCGKTAIAREYAERFWRCYRQIFWIDCRKDIESSLADLYPVLFPANAQGSQFTDHEKAQRVLAEFKNPDAPLRLLIYDGTLDQDAVVDWLPNTGKAHTIITSCYKLWTAGIQTNIVQLLNRKDAHNLLLRNAKRNWANLSPSERTACADLAEYLDFLPLTLVQAGAYISQEPPSFGFGDYLRICKAAGHQRVRRQDRELSSNNYPSTAYDTWFCTSSHLLAGPHALLRLSSFLSPAPIPLGLFTRSPKMIVEMCRTLDPNFSLGENDKLSEETIREFKTKLASYAMITLMEDDYFRLDNLLLEVERQETPRETRSAWVEFGLRLFADYAPSAAHQTAAWPIWRTIYRHVQKLMEYPQGDRPYQVPAGLLTELAAFLIAIGRYHEAIKPAEFELNLLEKSPGSDPIPVCTLLDLLGTAHLGMGNLEQAEDYSRRALEGRERHLGLGHRQTLASQSNLAGILLRTNQTQEAEDLYRQSWEGCKRHPELGRSHEETVCSALGLAATLARQSRAPEALELYESQYRICQDLRRRDRMTIICMSGLAAQLEKKGEMARVEDLYRSACTLADEVLGWDNPATCTCKENFASFWLSQNKPEEAISLYKQALNGRFGTSDIRDPDAYACLHNLATVLESSGKTKDVHPLLVHHIVTLFRAQKPSALDEPVLQKLLGDLQSLLERCGKDRDAILDEMNDILRPFNCRLQAAPLPSEITADQE